MDYAPFKDYLGLSQIAWKPPKDILDDIMPCPPCRRDDVTSSINADLFVCTDPLDIIRSNAAEEFSINGVDVDMDSRSDVTYVSDVTTTLSRRRRKKKVCVFCRNNGEPETIYRSHVLKDPAGRTTCPVLRRYVCPTCGASGDHAHTLKYCPRREESLVPALSLLIETELMK